MQNRERPFGLVAIALYMAVTHIIVLVFALLLMVADSLPISASEEANGLLLSVLSIFSFAYGIVMLAATFGLWSFEEWGRKVIFWVSLVSIFLIAVVIAFPEFFDSQLFLDQEATINTASNALWQLVNFAISAFIVFYLSRDRVRALFLPEQSPTDGALQANEPSQTKTPPV